GLVAAVFIGLAFWIIRGVVGQTEESRFEQARAEYREKNFAEAARRFRDLAREYSGSTHHAAYKFFGGLSAIRQPAYNPRGRAAEIKDVYDRLRQLAEDHKNSPLLKESRADIRDTLHKVAEHLTQAAEEDADRNLLALAGRVLQQARKYKDGQKD